MLDLKRELKRGLFGLSQVKVHSYFRRVRQLEGEEVGVLEDQLLVQQRLNERLSNEISQLTEQNNIAQKKNEISEHANHRLVESERALLFLGDYEANAILEQSLKRQAVHQQQVEHIETESLKYEEAFRTLLNELSGLITKVNQLEGSEVTIDYESENSSMAEVAATRALSERSGDSSTAESEFELHKKERDGSANVSNLEDEELASLHKRAKVIQFKLRAIVNQHDIAKQQVTVAKHQIEHEVTTSLPAASSSGWEAQNTTLTKLEHKSGSKLPASNFWGDLNGYLSEDASTIASSNEVTDLPNESIPTPDSHKESPALSEEISTIRNRYIVGKLSGVSIYGQDGQLIINENQTITSDIVEQADREGKLSDLIVHMLIPESNEDRER